MKVVNEKIQFLIRNLYDVSWESSRSYFDKDHSKNARISRTLEELKEIGQPALDYLLSILNDNLDMDHLLEPVYYPSRSRVTGKYDENRVYEPDEVGVKTTIIKMLRAFGNLSFAPLCSYLQNHEDSHVHIRMAIYLEFMRLGEAAYPALVSAIEDPSTQIVLDILYFFETNKLPRYLSDRYEYPEVNAQRLSDAIIEELILRTSHWPDHYFNSKITAKTLKLLIESNTRLERKIQTQLCNIAYKQEGAARERAIDVARRIDATGFANIVERKAKSNQEAADKIMGWLGGNEAVAYFLRRTDESIVGTAQGKNKEIKELFWRMDSHFDKDELETFCFLLEIEYDNLRGETKQAKIRELLKSAKRTNQISEIVRQARLLRPNVDWPGTSENNA